MKKESEQKSSSQVESKTESKTQSKIQTLLNRMDESELSELISKHWPKFTIGFIALIAMVFIGQFFLSKKNRNNKYDYIFANSTFESFRTGYTPSTEDLQVILKVLDKHPELHPKYDGILAQTFFYQENIAQALVYARKNIERIERNQPSPYVLYSEGSLLIAQNQLKEALESSEQLNNYFLSQNIQEFPFLRLSNLLRIATLSKHLQDPIQEISAWKQIDQFSHDEQLQTQVVFEYLNSFFQQGHISLKEYMTKRMQELSKATHAKEIYTNELKNWNFC